MVNSPDGWLWSSWHCMLGHAESSEWLSIDALLLQFANNRADAIRYYIEFVKAGIGKDIWNELQHQIFLGDDRFVAKYQAIHDAYCSGGYTQKQIGDYFGLHYSQVSRIIANTKI